MRLTNVLLRFQTTQIKTYFDAPLEPKPPNTLPYLLLLGAALALTLLYFSEVSQLPLLAMLQDPGDTAHLARLREDAFSALDSPFLYAFSVLREALYPLLIAALLGNFLYTRRRLWLLLFLVTLSAGLLFASVSIARGPVATIFLVLMAFWFLYRPGRIRARRIAVGLLMILLFPALVTYMTQPPAGNLTDTLKAVGIRLFYSPAYVAYVYFEAIPSRVGFQHGATIGKLAPLLGKQHFDMARYALLMVYPNAPESGSAGGAFFADFYANFGMLGVLIGGILIGIIMQGIQILLLRSRKTPASLAAYAFMFYAFWMTTSRTLPTVLLSTGVSFVLLFWWILSPPGVRREFRVAERGKNFGARGHVRAVRNIRALYMSDIKGDLQRRF